MSDKELSRALLDLDARTLAGATDPREPMMKIIERDRRRLWWLTSITIGLWAAAILMVLWMLVAFGLLMPLQAKLIQDAKEFHQLTPAMQADAQHKAQIMFQMITVGVTCSVGLLALATLSTLILLGASRRATLRQINASLLEISEQLKALRKQTPTS